MVLPKLAWVRETTQPLFPHQGNEAHAKPADTQPGCIDVPAEVLHRADCSQENMHSSFQGICLHCHVFSVQLLHSAASSINTDIHPSQHVATFECRSPSSRCRQAAASHKMLQVVCSKALASLACCWALVLLSSTLCPACDLADRLAGRLSLTQATSTAWVWCASLKSTATFLGF